jgi:Ribonuclease G/E
MAVLMKANGKMMCLQAEGKCIIVMVLYMTDNGLMEIRMEKGSKKQKMAHIIPEIFPRVKKAGKASFIGQVEAAM